MVTNPFLMKAPTSSSSSSSSASIFSYASSRLSILAASAALTCGGRWGKVGGTKERGKKRGEKKG